MRTLGGPYDLRMLATASATWLSLETSQITAWVSGSSCSSARMRSADRASAITRNPPPENRRTIADPVPGPTPVTLAIGLSVIGGPRRQFHLSAILDDYRHITQRHSGNEQLEP